MAGGGKGEPGFLDLPTFTLAGLLAFFLICSTLFERGIHWLKEYLRKRKRNGLAQAVSNLVLELTLVGFISLLLTALQSPISSICVTYSAGTYTSWDLISNVNGCDCCLAETTSVGACFASSRACGPEFCNCEGQDPACLSPTESLTQILAAWEQNATCLLDEAAANPAAQCSQAYLQQLKDAPEVLASKAKAYCDGPVATDPNKCGPGKAPLVTVTALHQLHIFIFVVAMTHVTMGCLMIVLASWQLRSWRKTSEDEDDEHAQMVRRMLQVKMTPASSFDRPRGLLRLVSSFRSRPTSQGVSQAVSHDVTPQRLSLESAGPPVSSAAATNGSLAIQMEQPSEEHGGQDKADLEAAVDGAGAGDGGNSATLQSGQPAEANGGGGAAGGGAAGAADGNPARRKMTVAMSMDTARLSASLPPGDTHDGESEPPSAGFHSSGGGATPAPPEAAPQPPAGRSTGVAFGGAGSRPASGRAAALQVEAGAAADAGGGQKLKLGQETPSRRNSLLTRSGTIARNDYRGHFREYLFCLLHQLNPRPVAAADIRLMRASFMLTHRVPAGFDFWRYVSDSLEDDFAQIVGLSAEMWFTFLVFVLVSGPIGWATTIFLSLAAIVLVIVNVKLIQIIRHVCRGCRINQLSSNVFWLGKPALLLHPIKYVLFLCSFIMAAALFFLWSFGAKSCPFTSQGRRFYFALVVPWWVMLIFAGIIFLDASFRTLPVYSLAVQMGSDFKAHMLPHGVREKLLLAAQRIKAKHKEQQRLAAAEAKR